MQLIRRQRVLVALIAVLAAGSASFAQDPPATQSAQEQHARQVLQSLKWIKGPTTVAVGDNATLALPGDCLFLGPADTQKFQELNENPSNEREVLLAPRDLHWFALLSYEATGYVKDEEKVDADAVLKSIQEGTEAANAERKRRGWQPFHVKGWRYPPAYDNDTKRLEWAIDGESGGVTATNFLTKILGRDGVTSAVLVTNPERLPQATREFKAALTGYQYKDGHRYAEYRPGDKVAEYGLAGLIAGGAVAVAAKTGLLKGLWKFLAVGAAAGLAALRRLFGKKKDPAA